MEVIAITATVILYPLALGYVLRVALGYGARIDWGWSVVTGWIAIFIMLPLGFILATKSIWRCMC